MMPASRSRHGGGLRAWSGAAVAFLLVLAILFVVTHGLAMSVDRALLHAMMPTRLTLPPALALTWLGDSAIRFVMLAVVVAAMLARRRWRTALWLALVVTGGTAANSGMKWLVARPRPDLLPHLDAVTSYSFPSGHAAGVTVLWFAFALLAPGRLRIPLLLAAGGVAIATGLSRIVLAVHWPSDVAAGWAFGLGWVLLWQPLLRRRG